MSEVEKAGKFGCLCLIFGLVGFTIGAIILTIIPGDNIALGALFGLVLGVSTVVLASYFAYGE